MKLYATTTSERASKGQGGENLEIIIYNEDKEVAVVLKVTANNTGGVRATAQYNPLYGQIVIDRESFLNTKGEKQKGKRLCGMRCCEETAEFNELCDSHYRANRMS